MRSTTKAKPDRHTAPPQPDKTKPPSEADKRFYTAKVRALYAYGDHEAHLAPASLFPLSMPHGFARRRLNIQLSALKRGPLHGAFVDQLVNDVALEYVLRWDEEERDKWPPPTKEELEGLEPITTKTTGKKKIPSIMKARSESSEVEDSPSPDEEETEDDDSPDYEPDDDDDSSGSGG